VIRDYQISSEVCDSPPHAGESKPADEEAEGEDEEDVPPLDVEHGVEEVGDVTSTTLRYVRSFDTNHAFIGEERKSHRYNRMSSSNLMLKNIDPI